MTILKKLKNVNSKEIKKIEFLKEYILNNMSFYLINLKTIKNRVFKRIYFK